MRVIQMPYTFIVNAFWKVLSFLPQSLRSCVAVICSTALMLLFTNSYCLPSSKFIILEESLHITLCYVLVFLIIVFSMNRKAEPVPFNLWLFVPGLIFVVWMVVAYSMHPIGTGFQPFIIALIVLIPAGALALNDLDSRETFASAISYGMVINGIITLAISLVRDTEFFSEDGILVRYEGITRNSNLFAMVLLGGIIGLLYLIAKKALPRVILWILFIPFFAFLVMTQSRSAGICLLACLLLFLAWWIEARKNGRNLNSNDPNKSKKLLRILLIAFIILVFIMIVLVIIMRPVIISMLTGGEITGTQDGNEIYDIINNISSMRLGLWVVVYGELNLYGHELENFGDLLPERYQYDGAHNTALDFGYRCGAPCGAAFLLFELLSVLYALVLVKRADASKPSQVFIILIVFSFFVESMLEIQVLPSNRNITMLFFIVSMLILSEPRDKEIEDSVIQPQQNY